MEKKKIKLSVAIATYNEGLTIAQCLDSVKEWTDETVLVDGGSTDDTVTLAKQYGARIVEADNPAMFHINKQKALDQSRGEWILQLDADEVVPDELKEEIVSIIRKNPKENGLYIPRKNFFLGHWLSKGGQYPDYVIRLLRRGKGTFPCKSVHEQISIDGEVGYLRNPLLHYSYRSIGEYWKKASAYTSLTAAELKAGKIKRSSTAWIRHTLLYPLHTFTLLFFRHKGFVDGVYGFLFALFSALHHPIAWYKYSRL